MRLALLLWVLFAIGCVRVPPPTAAYFGPLKTPRRAASDLDAITTTPKGPYEDLGTVEVSCPTVTESHAGPYGGTAVAHGGCSYANAIFYAKEKAAEAGADGLYGIRSSAASNGKIVSLTATAFRLSDEGALPAETVKSDAVSPATPTLEERLRTLQDLHDKKLITDQEYEQKKAELLKEI